MRNERGQFIKGHKPPPGAGFQPGHHWRPRQRWWDKEWLESEYATKSAAQIAVEGGVTENAILFWLHKHGIPRRSMAEVRALKHWGCSGSDNPMFGVIGPDNPNYKDGRSEGLKALYTSPEWHSLREAILAQANGECVRCGGKHRLHIHCTRPDGGVAAHWEEGALVVLCKSCHGWVHSRKNTAGEYLTREVQAHDC